MWYTPMMSGVLRLLLGTVRWRSRNEEVLQQSLDQGDPFILAFWHGSMAYPWWRMRGGKAAALVSRSKDGSILADLLSHWSYHVVRGSSSRGGADAMELMRSCLSSGYALCMTPDGPRGPRHVMKMGAVRLAQTEGVPLILCAVAVSRKKVLKSWDAFEVPCPFAKGVVLFSPPIHMNADCTRDQLEQERLRVEEQLADLHRQAKELLGSTK